jgi:hypothetical protein
MFVLKIGTNGSQTWAKPIGSAAEDRCYAISGNGSRIVLVGDTKGSVDRNPGRDRHPGAGFQSLYRWTPAQPIHEHPHESCTLTAASRTT